MPKHFCATFWKKPEFIPGLLQYLLYGEEKCETTGRIHWQTHFIYLKSHNKGWRTIALEMKQGGTHVETVVNPEESKLYCMKGEQSHKEWKDYARHGCMGTDSGSKGPNWGKNAKVTEYGEWSSQGKRNDLEELNNRKPIDYKKVDPILMIKYPNGLRMKAEKHGEIVEERENKPRVIINFGVSGSGKSFSIRQKHKYKKDLYEKPLGAHEWITHYHPNVHNAFMWDDFRESDAKFNFMLRLCGEGPCEMQVKNGWKQVLAPIVYITSDTDPRKWYNGDPQWLRRIDEIWEYTEPYVEKKKQKPPICHKFNKTKEESVPEFWDNKKRSINYEMGEEILKELGIEFEKNNEYDWLTHY